MKMTVGTCLRYQSTHLGWYVQADLITHAVRKDQAPQRNRTKEKKNHNKFGGPANNRSNKVTLG
jgi:ATP adenylyltransferase/5',5'''-P-1,P-4-tetraphosphate phosphorylase II